VQPTVRDAKQFIVPEGGEPLKLWFVPDSTLSGLAKDSDLLYRGLHSACLHVQAGRFHPRLFKLSTSGAPHQAMIESSLQNGNQFFDILLT
jgi:hypothetical protein